MGESTEGHECDTRTEGDVGANFATAELDADYR